MKIFLLSLHSISTPPHGGSTRVFFKLANGLAARNHNVFALAPLNDVEQKLPLHSDVCFFDLNKSNNKNQSFAKSIHKLQTFFIIDRKKRRAARSLLDLSIYKSVIESIQQRHCPDVIISFQQESTYLLVEHIKTSIPVITMIHRAPREYFNKPEFPTYKSALENCAGIQVLMPEYIEEARQFIPQAEIFHIPNAVPQYLEQSSLLNPVIIHVGRVTDVKRQHLIVEAFAKLKDSFPEWRVELWGACDSSYATNLQKRIKQLGLLDRVFCCGTTSDVTKKLLNASIFIFPSKFEGFSLALSEALSMGLPAVGCKNCPSVNTIIRDGENGLLCEDNPDDLAQKMQLLMSNLNLRKKLGSTAKQDMRLYSEETIISKWEVLLQDICS